MGVHSISLYNSPYERASNSILGAKNGGSSQICSTIPRLRLTTPPDTNKVIRLQIVLISSFKLQSYR